MIMKCGSRMGIALAAVTLILGFAGALRAQGGMGQQSAPASPKQTGTADTPPAGAGKTLTLDTAPSAPASAEEDAAFKAFQDAPTASDADVNHKIALGEAFDLKYPLSRYRPVLYAKLTLLYLQTNQVQKMEVIGDKEVQLTPTDVQTMAILALTIPRALGSYAAADATKELAKAEEYSKRAIEVTPTISKPAGLTDEQFVSAKNSTLGMAHGGLGLVYFRRGKYDEAIVELDQSIKIDPTPDPVNYYVLAVSNEKASHFQDAVAAYNKCASLQSSLQQTCKTGAEQAKKLGATQLSVPK